MAWMTRLRNLLRSNRHSTELDREIDFHILERADDLVARGMAPDAALVEARRLFGNRGAKKEQTRDADLFPAIDSVRGDIRYAWRALVASPVFTTVAVASLALGIGANTTIFSLIDSLLLRPLPVVDPDGLVRVTFGSDSKVFTNPAWEAFRDRQTVFSSVFAVASGFRSDLATTGVVRPVRGSYVSGEFFSTLGVRPAAGRLLVPADDYRGCPAIAVLGHAFWRSEYGADASVIGRSIPLAGKQFRIVGVAEERFFGVSVGSADALYAPLCANDILQPGTLDHRRNWFLMVMGRPRPGVTPAQLTVALRELSPSVMEASLPDNVSEKVRREHLALRFAAEPGGMGSSYLRMTYTKALYALAAIVGIVLLVACANVANLLLARGASRRREVAVRLALGASRARLARQLVTESLLLSLAGAAFGVVIAQWGGRVLVSLIADSSPVYLDLSPNWRIVGFASGVAVLTALLFGVIPALRETKIDPQEAIKSGGRGMSLGRNRAALGRTLVASQLALALVIIVTAGLLLGTFRRLATEDPGFNPDHVVMISTRLRDESIKPEQVERVNGRFLAALRSAAFVEAATTMNATPIGGAYITNDVIIGGAGPASERSVRFNYVGADYFSTLGMRLLAGRAISDEDRRNAPEVAVVNQTAVRLLFGGQNPIGRTFRQRKGETEFGQPIRVVGVVSDAKYSSLRQSPPATIYGSIAQLPPFSPTFAIRSSADPATLAGSITAIATTIEPRLRLTIYPLSNNLSGSLVQEHVLALLSTFFAGLTLLLATMGVYGIMAYEVSQRRNEFGIRIAVGATPRRVIALVCRQTLTLVGAGIAAGGIIAVASTRLIGAFLYGMTPTDPTVIAMSMGVLLVVAAGASIVPALRASRVDPVFALRED